METRIEAFLETKGLRANSRAAYTYDLRQFAQLVGEQVSTSKLQVYESHLSQLSPSARRRKLSAVNQFLLYLYETGAVSEFHRLKTSERVLAVKKTAERLDLAVFYKPTAQKNGQLVALLIWRLGLTPSELLMVKARDIQLDFQVMTVRKDDLVRVLTLPSDLLPYLEMTREQVYLFDKGGRPFSRQWLFGQLNHYLTSLGLADLTAQLLREQYILQQLAKGVGLNELAKQLGLKTTLTLQKYETHGY